MILLSWHSGEAREFCPIIDSPRHCARLARAVLVGMNFSKTTQAAHIVCSSYLSPYFTMASHKYYDLSSDDNGSYGNHYGDSSCSSSEDDDDDKEIVAVSRSVVVRRCRNARRSPNSVITTMMVTTTTATTSSIEMR